MKAKLKLQFNEQGILCYAWLSKQVNQRGSVLSYATTSTNIASKWSTLFGTDGVCEYYDTGMLRSMELITQISKTPVSC